jgi:hypothetical protein
MSNINTSELQNIAKEYPFLSFCTYSTQEYLGIIQNSDNQIVSMYVYNLIPTKELRKKFLKLGDEWWWNSARTCPINLFLKTDFVPFKPYLRTFNKKEFHILLGPCMSISDNLSKRVKRKQITLVKNIL